MKTARKMNQSNIVNLRWNQHQASMLFVFDTLLDNEKLTDCTISAEGRHLRAHKIILSACSPYFEELFTENNDKDPIIILHGVKYDVIKALMDFMYRGEVSVPQTELRGVFNLSEFLQVRGLSGSEYVDNVSMQNIGGVNSPPACPDDLPSQPASVSCFTTGQNETEEKTQSFRGRSPTVSPQEGHSVGVELVAKSIQKYRKGVNDSGSCERADQRPCQEVITPDCDRVHQLQSQRQVLPAVRNSTSGSVYSPNHFQPVGSELQATNGEMAVVENEQCLKPEAVLPDKMSTNLSAHKQEVSIETESEDLRKCPVIVEDLTLDDDSYCDDNVNSMQESSGSNLRSSSEALPSRGISVPCFTETQNEPEESMQSFRQWSSQEEARGEVDSISRSLRKYRKSVNQSGCDQGRVQNTFEEVITSDVGSVQQLSSTGHVLATTWNSNDGSVYSPIRELKTLVYCSDTTLSSSSYRPIARESIYRELQSSSGQMTVAENERLSMPEAVLTDGSTVSLSYQQQEVTVETKSEINENNMQIVEDLTLDDDDDYSGSGDYNNVEIDNREARNPNEGLTNEETVRTQGSNNHHSPFGRDSLSNVTLRGSRRALANQFPCHSCGKSYRYTDGLRRHMKYECGKERKFQCPDCSKRFARSDALKKHMTMSASCSTLFNQFTCYSCGKCFRYQYGLQRHKNNHCRKEPQF